jgi:hypothetical protein
LIFQDKIEKSLAFIFIFSTRLSCCASHVKKAKQCFTGDMKGGGKAELIVHLPKVFEGLSPGT